jgi:3-dehydroquinate synthase
MKKIQVEGGTGRSIIRIGERLERVGEYLPRDRVVIITDDNLWRLYGDIFPPGDVIRIGTGEGIKNLDTVQDVYRQMVACEADRSVFVLGIGGGIVCDVTGFVASTFMRGVRFGFVATTLLAQVDASVGGKNGVNFGGFKNMVGVFNQPEFVICDLQLLNTLPDLEIQCGFAEIVKHGAIADSHMFRYLEEHFDDALSLDSGTIERLVYDSVMIKSAVVNRDEKEEGERRKLNFGHTFGHAVEKVTKVPHGQAVSVGMAVAAGMSTQRGLLSPEEENRILRLLENVKLPTCLMFDHRAVFDALGKDKKRAGETIKFVLLDGIGRAVVEDISIGDLRQVLEAYVAQKPQG